MMGGRVQIPTIPTTSPVNIDISKTQLLFSILSEELLKGRILEFRIPDIWWESSGYFWFKT
jgi:hypothetical protein